MEEAMNSGTVVAQSLQLRLMVDKRKKRVVYAECDRFMADALFSFLVTPVGALVRRTGKDSGLGCMDSLYKSVENMDLHHFQTPACRELLLRPKSAFGFPHHRLKVAINDVDHMLHTCRQCQKISFFAAATCECGRGKTYPTPLNFPCPRTSDVVFIRKDLNLFVVTDDLFLAPSSDSLKHELCTLAGVEHSSNFLEEKIVLVDNEKIVELMKLSLSSNTPLTSTFLSSDSVTKPIHWPLKFLQHHLILKENLYTHILKKLGKDFGKMLTKKLERRKMSITLFHNQKSVVFAKVEREFIDLLFSFLTFPFGSIVMAASGRPSLGCLKNLHQVVKKFTYDGHFHPQNLLPTKYGEFILNPPVALHHNSQQLKMGRQPYDLYQTDCPTCTNTDAKYLCLDSHHTEFKWKHVNPKYKDRTTKRGGGYIGSPETFIITDAFVVKPIFSHTHEDHFASDLETKSVIVGQGEALKLLMASLISYNPLTDVFLD